MRQCPLVVKLLDMELRTQQASLHLAEHLLYNLQHLSSHEFHATIKVPNMHLI